VVLENFEIIESSCLKFHKWGGSEKTVKV